MKPRASVLLPVYEASPTLEVCLRSVARQTERDFEVLVVDDGSSDTTRDIARAFAASDDRFRVIERAHVGLVATLNAGIEHARGDVIVRMDGDDIMHKERLAVQLAALEDDTLSAVGCHVRLFPRRALGAGIRSYEAWLNSLASAADVERDAYVECPVAHPSLAVRREVLAGHRYRDMGWAEDYDLVLRLLAGGHRIGVVPRRLLMWRHHPSRLSRTADAYAIDRFTACRAHHLARSFLREPRYVLWGFGHTGKGLRRALAAEGKELAAIVDVHPGRIGQMIHGAPVIPPEALPRHAGIPLLVSVAGVGAREEIRAALRQMDRVEGRDFVCCA